MKLKKSLAAVLSLTAILSLSTGLVGCKKDKEPDPTPVTNNDETVVNTVLDGLSVPTTVTENFTLAISGVGGVKISWSSSNSDLISIVGGNATVVRPTDKDTSVELTATASLNSVEKTKKFTVTVTMQEDTSMTIADVLKAEDGASVEVKGVVTGIVKKYANNLFSVTGYWVSDSTGSIYVYGNSEVADGNLVSIKGTKKIDTYNEAKGVVLHEIEKPEVTVLKESEATPAFDYATSTTIGDLLDIEKGCAGKVYKVMATVTVNVTSTYTNFQLKDGNLSLGEYVSGSLGTASYEADFADYYANKDKTMVVYFAVQGKTGSGKWRGTALAMAEPTDADKASSQALAALNEVANEFFAVEDVTLPTGVTFTVGTNDHCSVADGKLKITSLPAKDKPASVELTATATVNGVSKSAKKNIVISGDVEKDITKSVTIENGKITIPYDVMDQNRVYVIKLDDTTTVKIANKNTYVNAGYKELMISEKGSLLVTIEGSDKKLTSLVSDVYGKYDNMKLYVGSDATGTDITPTATEKEKSVVYTYLTGTADAIYYENVSDEHEVGLYNLYLTVGTEALGSGATTPDEEQEFVGVVTAVGFKSVKDNKMRCYVLVQNATTQAKFVYIEAPVDDTNTVDSIKAAINAKFVVGKSVTVKGTVSDYKGLSQYVVAWDSLATDVTLGDTGTVPTYTNINDKVGNETELKALQGVLVEVTATYDGSNLVVSEGKSIAVYYENGFLSNNPLTALKKNGKYTVKGYLNWFNKAQISPISADAVTVVDESGVETPKPVEGVLAQLNVVDKKFSDSTWTYISDNPTEKPNPDFYGTDGKKGLKVNRENIGVKSGTFEAQNKVTVSINIYALNPNTKTSSSTDFFTIKGYNAAGEVVATAKLTSVVVGEANTVTLEGQGIVSVDVVMTGYPTIDGTAQNVNFGGVTVSKAA